MVKATFAITAIIAASLWHDIQTALILQLRDINVIHVVELLQEGNLDRETIMDELRAQFPNPTSNDCEPLLCDAIDLGVRLWLMIDVGEMIHSFIPG